MRRFLTLICLLGLALPAGISISGCTRNPDANYCNGEGFGLTITEVDSIIMQPQVAGISLAYGQTIQASTPSATTCKGTPASVNASQYSYGTTNNQLVDISPTGNICAGTWNRNTGGGIPDYEYCYYPNPLPSTHGLPYGIAYITATADSVTSNPVEVYVHAPVTNTSLVTTSLSSTSPQQCFSQNQMAELDVQACYVSNGIQYEFCAPSSVTSANYACAGGLAPGVTSVPSCGSSIGTLNFQVGTSSVASIQAATYAGELPTITALQPGTTVITSTLAQSSSSAGYFSTCPPASVSLALANGGTKGVITQGVTQNLSATVIDTQGNPISGLNLLYESTNPIDISASGTGSLTASYPGVASLYAVCEPPACNPAPINELGLNGTGLSLSSNPVNIITPGTTSDSVWFGAPGQSQYVYEMELVTGNPGLTSRLPYVPNSMVMDQQGTNIYFGSEHELMVYSTSSNSVSSQNTSVPGVVLAASPNASQLLINDQVRGVFYLYNVSGSAISTFGGMGAAAAWTPDSNTLFIVDSASLGGSHTNTLYVYNVDTGWSTYSLGSNGSQNLAITVPGLAAYLAGNPTVAHAWCPSGTVGNNASIQFYPQSDSVAVETSALGATSDGKHILGAVLNGTSINLEDIGVDIPANPLCPEVTSGTPPNQVEVMNQPPTTAAFSTNPLLYGPVSFTQVTDATAVNQVVTGTAPTTASVTTAAPIAFVTYNAPSTSTAAQLPYYLPQTSGTGPFGYVSFADAASSTPPTAPLAGAFSPDNSIFFVSTAGDNEIHFIGIPVNVNSTSAPPTDTQQVSPSLPACTPVSAGGTDEGCLYPTAPAANAVVPATVITVKPRSVT